MNKRSLLFSILLVLFNSFAHAKSARQKFVDMTSNTPSHKLFDLPAKMKSLAYVSELNVFVIGESPMVPEYEIELSQDDSFDDMWSSKEERLEKLKQKLSSHDSYIDLTTALQQNPDIEALCLNGFTELPDISLLSPTMQCLALDSTHLTQEYLEQLCTHCPNLKLLYLAQCPNLEQCTINVPHLRIFSLYDAANLNNITIIGSKLRFLLLDNCPQLTDQTVEQFSKNHPELMYMHIESRNRKDQQESIMKSPCIENDSLIELDLSNNTNLENPHIACKELGQIFLSFTSLTDEALKEICKNCPQLEEIWIEFTKVTPACTKELKQAYPHISIHKNYSSFDSLQKGDMLVFFQEQKVYQLIQYDVTFLAGIKTDQDLTDALKKLTTLFSYSPEKPSYVDLKTALAANPFVNGIIVDEYEKILVIKRAYPRIKIVGFENTEIKDIDMEKIKKLFPDLTIFSLARQGHLFIRAIELQLALFHTPLDECNKLLQDHPLKLQFNTQPQNNDPEVTKVLENMPLGMYMQIIKTLDS